MPRPIVQRLIQRIPSQCAVCHSWPAQPVCERCVARFAQPRHRCATCALPVPQAVHRCGRCIKDPPPLDACLAAVSYEFPWSRLLLNFKFGETPGWGASFALLMRSTPWVEPALDAAHRVIPLPLSTQRLQERGFNQAALLARHLAPAKIDQTSLLRIQHTRAQSELDRVDRLANVKHAFTVDPAASGALQGQRVVLVDDVMTSGASIYSAAAALRQVGVAHITAVVLARTDEPN